VDKSEDSIDPVEGRFPRLCTPDREQRDLRQLVLHRPKLVEIRSRVRVVAHSEILMASSLVDGVILSVAVLQAEGRISRYDTVCHGRSLDPLVKARALRDDAWRDSEFKLSHYQEQFVLDSAFALIEGHPL